jgi:hypothetical protein
VLPDFDAETKFPYGSKACLVPVALGHNLIHRICEEVDKRFGELGCIKRWHAYVFLKKSSTWHAVQRIAHIVFHNLCAHLGVPGRIMIKNIAGLICPLNSKTLVLIKVLANNLFHKICEEAPAGRQGDACQAGQAVACFVRDGTIPVLARSIPHSQAGRRPHVCSNFGRSIVSLFDSSTCALDAGLAHIVFHSLCAKPPGPVDNPGCLKNGLGNFSLMNQGVYDCYVRLRTILSTKNVKKQVRL